MAVGVGAMPVRIFFGSVRPLGSSLTRLLCAMLVCIVLVSMRVWLGCAGPLCCRRGRWRFALCVCLGRRRSCSCSRSGLVVVVRMRCSTPLGGVLLVRMSLVFVMLRLVCRLAYRRPRGDRRRAPGLAQDTQGLGSAFPRSNILHPHRPQDDPPQGNEHKQEQRLPVHRLPPFCGGGGASATAPSGSPIKRSTSAAA